MIICDIDNVLADDAWRIPFIDWQEPDAFKRFHEYHLCCMMDAASNLDLVETAEDVVLITAQPEYYRRKRLSWLRSVGIRWTEVLFRADNDHRGSVDVKRDAVRRIEQLGGDLAHVTIAIDDRSDVLAMYREEFGFRTLRIEVHHIEWHHNVGVEVGPDVYGVAAINPPRRFAN